MTKTREELRNKAYDIIVGGDAGQTPSAEDADAIDGYIDPIIARPNGIALARHPPHPHAALLFYDFTISTDGQNALRTRVVEMVQREHGVLLVVLSGFSAGFAVMLLLSILSSGSMPVSWLGMIWPRRWNQKLATEVSTSPLPGMGSGRITSKAERRSEVTISSFSSSFWGVC